MKILALVGRKRSGKDLTFEILERQIGPLNIRRIAFADPLKQEIETATGIPVAVANLPENRPYFRLLWQAWGTEFRRGMCGDNYWTKQTEEAIDRALGDGIQLLVITDCRFPNEEKLVHKRGGLCVRLIRPNQGFCNWLATKIYQSSRLAWALRFAVGAPIFNWFGKEHASERLTDTLEVDGEIFNDGSVGEFEIKIERLREIIDQHGTPEQFERAQDLFRLAHEHL